MPSPNAIAPPPSTARLQLSTVNSRLFCPNSFRFTHFRKNASASPLESHSFKTKDLKCPVFTHFQKKGGGSPLECLQFRLLTAGSRLSASTDDRQLSQQVGTVPHRFLQRLLPAPAADFLVVAAQQNLRHGPAAVFRR